jgi:hypothetical protein
MARYLINAPEAVASGDLNQDGVVTLAERVISAVLVMTAVFVLLTGLYGGIAWLVTWPGALSFWLQVWGPLSFILALGTGVVLMVWRP